MTIQPAVTQIAYQLAGANLGPFSTVFPYAEDSDVQAWLYLAATGPALLAGDDYTLTDLIPLASGGTVLLSDALLNGGDWPDGTVLVLRRATPESQPSAFGELAQFSPSASEAALDNVARQVQDLAASLAQTVSFPLGETPQTFPPASQRAGLILGFDGGGNLIALQMAQVGQGLGPASLVRVFVNGFVLIPATAHYCDTSAGALAILLPPSADVADLSVIEIWSGPNAAASPITVSCQGEDEVLVQGQTGNSFEIATPGLVVKVTFFDGIFQTAGLT